MSRDPLSSCTIRKQLKPGQRVRLKYDAFGHAKGKTAILADPPTANGPKGTFCLLFRFKPNEMLRKWAAHRFELAKPTGYSVRGALFRDVDQAINHATIIAAQLGHPVAVEVA